MRREQCGGCGGGDLEVVLDLGSTPLADAFPKSAAEPEDWYPLQLAVCRRCSLVQLTEIVPDGVLFGSDYAFYTGTSPSAVEYFAGYSRWLLDLFAEQARQGVVEIACNDGTLAWHLVAAGHRVVGVEPASGPAEVARARGVDVVGQPFGRAVAAEIGKVGLVVANNVAAHVADLDDFFGGIADLLTPDGVAVVEVQYLPDLLAGNQFDHVYHEHRQFFTVATLSEVMTNNLLAVREVIHTGAQGGSIRVVAEPFRRTSTLYTGHPGDRVASLGALRTMQSRVDYIRGRLLSLIDGELCEGRRTVAGYAASAKSTTLLNYCGIDLSRLAYVEDITPAKVGRVTPGTHIPIVAPCERDRPDAYLLLAWNYLSGVLRREAEFTAGGGRWIVPIPVPVVI